MAIHWKLRTLASSRGIYKACELQRRIREKTGIVISLQNLCNLLDKKPLTIKLKTMEIICAGLECDLSDFCEVKPGKFDSSHIRKLSYQNTPHKLRGKNNFPEPKDYE